MLDNLHQTSDGDGDGDDSLRINRDRLHQSLQIRCVNYLAEAKSQLFSRTIAQLENCKKIAAQNQHTINEQQERIQKQYTALEEAKHTLATLKNQLEHERRNQSEELSQKNRLLEQCNKEIIQERDRATQYLEISETIMIGLDTKGIITVINPHGCRILGLKQHEIIGKNWFDHFIPSATRRQSRHVYNTMISDTMISGNMGEHEYQESRIISANGEEITILWHNSLEKDDQGRIVGTVSSGQNTSQCKFMESAFIAKQEALNVAQAVAHIGNWNWELTQNTLDWSAEIYRIFGLAVQSITPSYEQFLSFVHPEDRQRVERAVTATLENSQQSYNLEHRIVRPDGSIRIVHGIGRIFRNSANQPIRMLGTVQDISERKQTENALLKSEQQFRSLVENMPSGVAVYEAYNDGEDFIFQSLNLSGERLSRVSEKEILGQPLTKVFPGIKKFGLFDVLQRVHKSGKTEYHPVSLYQDGDLLAWFEDFVYRLPSGKIVTIYNDVTEHQQALEKLTKSESMFRGLLNAFRDPLLLFTKDRQVLWCNESAADFMDADIDSIIGVKCIELCKDSTTPLNGLVNDCFQSGQSGMGRISANKVLEFRTFPIFHGEDHEVSHVILTATDIGEKTHLQNQAMHTARLATLGVLSGSIAHEINNPNNTILFHGPFLQDVWQEIHPILHQHKPDADSFSFGLLSYDEVIKQVPVLLSDITDCSRRIQRIVAQLKLLVRQQSDHMDEPVNLAAIINDAVALLHTKIQQMTNCLTLNLEKPLPQSVGNHQQLEQIVINLIMNALESLPNPHHGVTIHLQAGKEQKSVILKIEDEGIGMSEETMMHMMEPLFTTRADSGGTGLGLAVCSEFVKQHRGSLHFESSINQGTTAIVELPLRPASIP